MQNDALASIETFKCATVVMPRTPSATLVLAAQPEERAMPVEHDRREHHKRYDAALTTTTSRGLRAILLLVVLLILLGWAGSLYLNWRLQ